MRKRHLVAVPILCLLLLAVGQCDKYAKVGEAARDFAIGVEAFHGTEKVLHQQGKISDDEHFKLDAIILEVAQTGKTLDQAINQVHSNPQARAALSATIGQLNALLDTGILQVNNPDAKAQLEVAFLALKALVANIAAFS